MTKLEQTFEIKVGQKIRATGNRGGWGVVTKIEKTFSYPNRVTAVYTCDMDDGCDDAFLRCQIVPLFTVDQELKMSRSR